MAGPAKPFNRHGGIVLRPMVKHVRLLAFFGNTPPKSGKMPGQRLTPVGNGPYMSGTQIIDVKATGSFSQQKKGIRNIPAVYPAGAVWPF